MRRRAGWVCELHMSPSHIDHSPSSLAHNTSTHHPHQYQMSAVERLSACQVERYHQTNNQMEDLVRINIGLFSGPGLTQITVR